MDASYSYCIDFSHVIAPSIAESTLGYFRKLEPLLLGHSRGHIAILPSGFARPALGSREVLIGEFSPVYSTEYPSIAGPPAYLGGVIESGFLSSIAPFHTLLPRATMPSTVPTHR